MSDEIIQLIIKNMDDMKQDLKNEIHKLRKDIESLKKGDPILRDECERYRTEAKVATKEALKSAKGYPPWITVVFSVLASLIVFVVTYFSK